MKIQNVQFKNGDVIIQSFGSDDFKNKLLALSKEIKKYSNSILLEKDSKIYNFIKTIDG